MPSFDIVSELNPQEVDNAVNNAIKEITSRYDFKNSKSEIKLEKEVIKLLADDDYKMNAIKEILMSKMTKRGVDIQALEFGKVEPAGGSMLRSEVKLISGIETEKAKEINKAIKESKLKVNAQIQDEQLRVSGKNKDDLQAVMALVKGKDFKIPLQFRNFRD
ncbi:MAG: YajQ family cyclic di-GMP-binding protein [Deltaproteobacteria bacterium]|nr:YajQ family cyclic di-GMP-binding protein [Deltaproteobacteria bacterium]